MRPSDVFVRPRPVAAVDSDAAATQLNSGPVGRAINNPSSGVGGGVSGGPGAATAPMMTYFLADENDVDAALEAAGRDAEGFRAAIQNVRHIRGKAPAVVHHAASAPPRATPPAAPSTAPSRPATPDQSHAQPPHHHLPTFSPVFSGTTSQFGTPGPASLSAMSTPSSRRHSLSSSFMDDHLSSGGAELARGDALELAAGDTSVEPEVANNNNTMVDSGSAPQLIMPSIKMPSRRPFTDTGKSIGRLKVLLAGDSGVGKTSLVKAIVQACPHIVHVDSIVPPPPPPPPPPPSSSSSFSLATSRRSSATTVADAGHGHGSMRGRRRSSRSTHAGPATSQISEIYASTKPYPAWWNEVSDAGAPRRRKSIGDSVLDRNVCFVDTPGFTGNASPMDNIMPVVEHVEGHLQKLCSNALSDTDFVNLVSGDGGTFVDAVFYLISDSLKPADIEFLRRLVPLTNVIPLLAQADLLRSDRDVPEAKERIASQLHEAKIEPFVFDSTDNNPASSHALLPTMQPYAVSSAHGSDHEVMDASLLMSPDYVQPLMPSDLSLLIEHVFCHDGVSRLRHAAARKIARWRQRSSAAAEAKDDDTTTSTTTSHAPRPQHLYRPLSFGGSGSGIGGSSSLMGGSAVALARITDHTQREEQLARIRLASWAAELQRSLDGERAQYERLARSERAVWLTERLGECVQDGTLVAMPQQQQQQQQQQGHGHGQGRKTKRSGRRSMWSGKPSAANLSLPTSFSHEDPLGLLDVTAGLRARGLFVLEVLGSLSVLGSLAVWMANHNYHMQLYEWAAAEWTRLWNGEP